MNKVLTIKEILELDMEELSTLLSEDDVKKLKRLNIDGDVFLREIKDNATLTGLDDDEPFMTISDFVAYLVELNKQNIQEIEFLNTEEKTEEMEQEFKQSQLVSKVNQNNLYTQESTREIRKPELITNVTDFKELYNLSKKAADKKINDCVGQLITIENILIKKYTKKLDEPIINEKTGEIISDLKTTMAIVIQDVNGEIYVAGSVSFGYALKELLDIFGAEIKGQKIKIVKTRKYSNNQNQFLDFELV